MPSKSAFIIEGCFFEKNFRENEVFFKNGCSEAPLYLHLFMGGEFSGGPKKRKALKENQK